MLWPLHEKDTALTLPLFVSESGENVEQLWKYNFYNFKLHLCMSAHVWVSVHVAVSPWGSYLWAMPEIG